MKILFVSPTGTLDNGAEIATVQLMGYLVSSGHDVLNAHPYSDAATHQRYRDTLQELGVKSYPLATYQWWWPEAYPEGAYDQEVATIYYHRHITELRQLVGTEQIDLIISNTANVFIGAIVASCECIRHFWILHEFPVGEFAYYQSKIPFIAQLSEKVFAVEGSLTTHLKELLPTGTQVHSFVPYSPVTIRDLSLDTGRRLIAIGRVTENKNQLELIKAYQLLTDKTIPLIFIGDWEETYKKRCDDYLAEHGIETVEFLGFYQNPWSEVRQGDICVLTSKSETFSLVFVEGVLNGVPMITSDNPGYLSAQDYLGTGSTYSLGQVQDLADTIQNLLDKFEQVKENCQNAKEEARQTYTLDNCYRQFHEAILEQVKTSPASSLSELEHLFSLKISEEAQLFLQNQQIKIYFSDTNGEFSEKRTKVFPLDKSGVISFTNDQSSHIRIDLSELPGIYQLVQLVDEEHRLLTPKSHQGFSYKNGYVFIDNDPAIIYEVRGGQTLTLHYQKEQETCLKESIIHQQFSNYDQQLMQVTSDLAVLQEQYDQLLIQHHAIIGSRRWIIPTKIINFFRRNK